jgi:lipid-binding SYLF domain-containing protein
MATPDKGIPQDLLDKAHCIVIVPSLKTAAFIVGGKYGKGYLSCRNQSGEGWSAPATVRIEGGSLAFRSAALDGPDYAGHVNAERTSCFE